MLIALAGLPGTGKSTLARELASALGGVALDKDRVRMALFPPGVLDYSTAQNDFAMRVIYLTAAYLLVESPERPILIDGRTFSRQAQVETLIQVAADLNTPLRIVLCVCSDDTARLRLEWASAEGNHPARDRDFTLYLRLKARFEPLVAPHFTVNTDKLLEACVTETLAWLQSPAP